MLFVACCCVVVRVDFFLSFFSQYLKEETYTDISAYLYKFVFF